MKADIDVRSAHPVELFLDGVSVAKQKGPQKPGGGKPATAAASLRQGKHLVVVKSVALPSDTLGEWRVDVRIAPARGFDAAPAMLLEPARRLTIGDVLDAPYASDVRISPDGEYAALRMSKRSPPEGKRDEWIEVRRFRDARPVMTAADLAETSDWQWAPRGHRLSYIATKDEAGALRVHDIDTGEVASIVERVKGLSGYAWSPDGSFVVYTVRSKADKDESGVKRIREVRDRQEGARDETHVYLSTAPGGMTRRLTAGRHGAFVYDVHPDGRSVLVGRSYEDLSARPYNTTELVRLGLDDHAVEVLWKGRFLRDAAWSPDGKKILMIAGPSDFGDAGLDVPQGTIPNDYDGQAYIFDPATKSVDPITKKFDPAVVRAFWPRSGGDIVMVAEEADYVRLFRYGVGSKKFKRIDLDCDVIHAVDVAHETGAVVLTGSGANRPARLYAVDPNRSKGRLFLDPGAERFEHVAPGPVDDWNFTSQAGRAIAGRIHYPPDFDPGRTWPCIVYYYGGTSPVDRSFGGRYPKDLWAAHGYVVYVLQPSGATGFGQEFSAAHVNDWGEVVSGEIIEGVEKFLDAHPFVDPHRIGCIGASFGGFMTQLLVTKTDIFSAAVSHAGISSISSYWGEGYWGYDYNAVSAANSFPWNRPDIYVDRSPLFSADKIATPLLLLHGTEDTNVPPGESEQMYTALKLLGREVEYLRIGGQNHFVLDYKKRIVWSDAILGWFDKWLKDEPQWWDGAYPPVAAAGKKRPGEIGLRRAELEGRGTVLFGRVTREDIRRDIADWGAEYGAYLPDGDAVSRLREGLRGVRVTCVFGTWCGDSRREVPRLWRVLDEAGYPESRLTMYAVGSARFTEDMPIPRETVAWSNDVKSWYDVSAVATIILHRGGRELGRIVETPEATLEGDLLRIVGR
jgi:dipeptidyl aminopeptidase/acylaminoacyl peptidase